MRCVVCKAEIASGSEHYANTYERIRARLPCCGPVCTSQFDPDTHWIPGARPAPLPEAEQVRLIRVLRDRLVDGDNPTVVVREMLVAGVAPRKLRLQLHEASTRSAENRTLANKLAWWGALRLALTGRGKIAESADRRDPAAIDGATAAVDEWERVFP